MGTFQRIGLLAQSLKGWLTVLTVLAGGLASASSYIDGLGLTHSILLGSIVFFLVGIGSVFLLGGIEIASSYFTTRQEQKRIAKDIRDQIESNIAEIDTGTAAAIWAGTRADGDIYRHLCFRRIKAAIAAGEIRNTRQRNDPDGRPGPNLFTWMSVSQLAEFFVRKGVVLREDVWPRQKLNSANPHPRTASPRAG